MRFRTVPCEGQSTDIGDKASFKATATAEPDDLPEDEDLSELSDRVGRRLCLSARKSWAFPGVAESSVKDWRVSKIFRQV